MTDILLRDIPDEMHATIKRLAEEHGHSPEEEARDILHQALFRQRVERILQEQGLGSALQAIGREFQITTEFDDLRSREQPRHPTFE